jgi:hypothetical protein
MQLWKPLNGQCALAGQRPASSRATLPLPILALCKRRFHYSAFTGSYLLVLVALVLSNPAAGSIHFSGTMN